VVAAAACELIPPLPIVDCALWNCGFVMVLARESMLDNCIPSLNPGRNLQPLYFNHQTKRLAYGSVFSQLSKI